MADFLVKLPDGGSGTSVAQEAVSVGDLNRVIGVLNGTDGPVGAKFFALSPPTVAAGLPYTKGGLAFYANDYAGVDPTGATDSTTGLQNAATAAIASVTAGALGKLVLFGSYTTSAAISLLPASGSQFLLDIDGGGKHTGTPGTEIYFNAAAGSVFSAKGWKQSRINGVRIATTTTANGVVAWDLDCDGTRTSLGQLSFYDCFVNMVTGAQNCVGWRMGHAGGATGDISDLQWYSCTAQGNVNNVGHIGWLNEHGNGLHYSYYGGFGLNLAFLFSNTATAGAVGNGAGGQHFYGMGASGNLVDFDFRVVGQYGIYGGRFEVGTTFIQSPSQSGAMSTVVVGAELGAYTVGAVINYLSPGSLTLINFWAVGANYTAAFITTGGFTGKGHLILQGGGIRTALASGVDPFTLGAGWTATVLSVGNLDSSNRATNWFPDHLGALDGVQAPAFSATPTVDFSLGAVYAPGAMTANVTAITISSIWKGMRVRFVWLQNGAGGFTVAYPASCHLSNAAAMVTTLNTTTIDEFESYDGTTLRLVARSTGQT